MCACVHHSGLHLLYKGRGHLGHMPPPPLPHEVMILQLYFMTYIFLSTMPTVPPPPPALKKKKKPGSTPELLLCLAFSLLHCEQTIVIQIITAVITLV